MSSDVQQALAPKSLPAPPPCEPPQKLRPHGIKVCCIMPSFVETQMALNQEGTRGGIRSADTLERYPPAEASCSVPGARVGTAGAAALQCAEKAY